jgi:hypothetical protein
MFTYSELVEAGAVYQAQEQAVVAEHVNRVGCQRLIPVQLVRVAEQTLMVVTLFMEV